ncbi:hypothetical protein KFL_009650020 [Klebsormidium nitens]|uniref:Uncharacterized protein n=1 Tax=Klebsormidium nitens TaxID=105231 RepID=A0A1Y1IN17_KLENI|nr:hypothetical protein KFL_009650020 [Klebsormidium nitens]|eukprot:GAQ92280.1 hypothetical protein KFL_009650020 [Klebsormidium nitens]
MTAAALAGFMAANMLPEEDGAPDALYAALYGALGAGFLALGPMPRCIGDKTILFGLRMCAAARQALGLPDVTSIRKGSRLVEPGKGKGEKAVRRKRRGEYDPEYDTHWVTLAPELDKEKLPFDPFFESIRAPRYVDFKKQGVDLKGEDLPEGIEDFTSDSWDQDEVGCWFCKVGLR